MPDFDCLRCGTAMHFVGQHKLQLGKTSWIFGDLPNLMAGALDVSIMACPACGKLEFFTGGAIPIPFFPVWLQRVVYALPFGSMQNMPYLIYTGQLAGTAALKGLALQLAWLAVLLTAGKLWMGRAMNKVVVQGG